ncbi:MAG: hypothetical protein JWO05_896 [Gemmatimonadetes bacterium]|nr:hypothetical protein [Gemmatimonadota bacterium]
MACVRYRTLRLHTLRPTSIKGRRMSSEAHGARSLTRRLVTRAAAGRSGPDVDALAAASACEIACAELSLSLGPPGFDALLRRALVQAEPEFPFLATLRVNRHPEHTFDGVARLTEENGGARVAAALETVLESMFAALGRLIGDDLVARLVERDTTGAMQDGGSLT